LRAKEEKSAALFALLLRATGFVALSLQVVPDAFARVSVT
jgi:hypothetical protein